MTDASPKPTAKPQPQPGIDRIKLYTPGDAGIPDRPIRKLSSNENLYGPSPKAIEAVKSAAGDLWKYPSTDHASLRAAIAKVHKLPAQQIICAGMGSDEILYSIAQAYAGIGDEIITTEHGFEVYGIAAHAVGAALITAPEKDRQISVEAILDAVSEKTRIVYIANPANPTGTMLSREALTQLADGLPLNVVLVIDSAYAEFSPDYDGGSALASTRPNVIMTRTFSKLYGLGGLRIGWAFADQAIIDTLNRIRIPFNLSVAAMAGAKAAMLDQDYANKCRDKIIEDRDYMIGALRQLGLELDESHTNFVLARFESEAKAVTARAHLADHGYLVRNVAHYGLPQALRISIGTHEDCIEVVRLLTEFMEGENG